MKKNIFLLFFIVTGNYFSQNLDLRILKSLNQKEIPKWDQGMRFTSNTVNPLIPVSVIGIWSHGYFTKDHTMMRNAYKSGISIAFAALTTASIKLAVQRERPYKKYPNDITARTHSGPYSFPSGHTTSAFAMATALTLSYQEWYVAVPAYVYAGLVGYSRMRLGMHFPSDVFGGMVIGIGSGFLVWQLDRLINDK
jgi:membrane-associated phospholipid phosphatase